MPKKSRSQSVVNLLGGLGYLSCIIQWLWSVSLLMPAILQNDIVRDFLAPHHAEETAQVFHYSPPPLLAIIIGAVVTAVVLIVSIILIIRLPAAVSKKAGQAVIRSAEHAISIEVRNHPMPVARKHRLRARYILLIKLLMMITPLGLLLVTLFIEIPFDSMLIFTIGIFLASWTLLWIGLQYLFMRILRVPIDQVS